MSEQRWLPAKCRVPTKRQFQAHFQRDRNRWPNSTVLQFFVQILFIRRRRGVETWPYGLNHRYPVQKFHSLTAQDVFYSVSDSLRKGRITWVMRCEFSETFFFKSISLGAKNPWIGRWLARFWIFRRGGGILGCKQCVWDKQLGGQFTGLIEIGN